MRYFMNISHLEIRSCFKEISEKNKLKYEARAKIAKAMAHASRLLMLDLRR